MQLKTLHDVTQAGSYVVFGSFAGGVLFSIISLVSRFALPRLGYQTIGNIPATAVSKYAFAAAGVCFSTFAIFSLAFFAIAAFLPPLPPREKNLLLTP